LPRDEYSCGEDLNGKLDGTVVRKKDPCDGVDNILDAYRKGTGWCASTKEKLLHGILTSNDAKTSYCAVTEQDCGIDTEFISSNDVRDKWGPVLPAPLLDENCGLGVRLSRSGGDKCADPDEDRRIIVHITNILRPSIQDNGVNLFFMYTENRSPFHMEVWQTGTTNTTFTLKPFQSQEEKVAPVFLGTTTQSFTPVVDYVYINMFTKDADGQEQTVQVFRMRVGYGTRNYQYSLAGGIRSYAFGYVNSNPQPLRNLENIPSLPPNFIKPLNSTYNAPAKDVVSLFAITANTLPNLGKRDDITVTMPYLICTFKPT
jgi:hypothetical protein